ncbi:DUF6779 domain-containing protein [Mycobacterium sp. Marseille-P9652]|uniref:DUF6779 domain-containing protein n=1 Tax=Mycobacterium sp. Marseille-P9652 TaxID=2654950 RepID=UPI0012E74E15|nr:DUF6779 domain-containing protein [Mycobacterium sp. Marseille-P9652]
MTVLSRGARVRRGGRRPGWVLLTALLVLAIGASSALVFTNRVELLKLAVILALWAAVAGAFVSVLYRRQSDADQARVRDLKLVYDLQLDREISARREYELTVESQLRRELASELRAQAEDDLAALRAELSALRTSLEVLFDTDLQHRPALETVETEAPPERAYSEWDRNGDSPRSAPADWVSSDRVTTVPQDRPPARADETAIIDVTEVGVPPVDGGPLLPPRQPTQPERVNSAYEGPREAPDAAAYGPPPEPEPRFEPRHRPPPQPEQPQPQPQMQGWQPAPATGLWLPPGAPGSQWVGGEPVVAPVDPLTGRRARHSDPDQPLDGAPVAATPPDPYADAGRRARSRHSAEYRDYGVRNFTSGESGVETPPAPQAPPPPAAAPAAAAPTPPAPPSPAAEPPPPQMAPPPNRRHRSADSWSEGSDDGSQSGGQSVAELLARLQVQPSGGGRRRRRDG